MSILTVSHLTKTYTTQRRATGTLIEKLVAHTTGVLPEQQHSILKNVSFTTEAGTITGIHGGNGAGKTTLLRCIAGILQPDHGSITYSGKMRALLSARVGWRERLSVIDNLILFGAMLGISSQTIHRELNAILRFAGLTPYAHVKAYELSQGMLSRLAVALVLHAPADILLLDEVMEHTDEEYKQRVIVELKRYAKGGTCIIFVSHEKALVRQITSKILSLDNGQIHS